MNPYALTSAELAVLIDHMSDGRLLDETAAHLPNKPPPLLRRPDRSQRC